MKHLVLVLITLLNSVILALPSGAQTKVRLNWSALAGTQSGFWVAREEGIRENDPKAKQSKAEDFPDMRFVAELEREGFFKKLWGK